MQIGVYVNNFKDVNELTIPEQTLRKVAILENHICNLISNVQCFSEVKAMKQCIQEFHDLQKSPLKIDSSDFIKVADMLRSQVAAFCEQTKDFEVNSLVSAIKDLAQEIKNINERIDNMEKFGVKKFIHLDVGLLNGELSIPVHSGKVYGELEFSIRTDNILRGRFNMNDNTPITELAKYTEFELLSARGFGRNSLREVKEKLEQYRLSLGMKI